MLALTISGQTEFLPEDNQEEAMRRYWTARQGGDASAKLVRVDPAEVQTKAEERTPRGVVSEVAKERIERQEAELAKAGFALRPPLFAPGTRVMPLGDQNFSIERTRVEELPRFPVAAERVREEIRLEEREDYEVDARELQMLETGEVLVEGTPLKLERGAFHQLAMLGGWGMGARFLAERCTPELRALNVNAQLAYEGDDRRLKLRTRKGSRGGRSVFATVTPTYAPVDSDQVLEVVMPDLEDAHVEMRYDGAGVRATALWMPDEVVDLAAGDIFKVGVRVESDDTGRGRIRIAAVVWRNLCLNLIIIDEGSVETVSFVHRGSPQKLIARLSEGVAAAREKVGSFLDAWGHARTVKVDALTLMRSWVAEKKLELPGVRTDAERDAVVEELLSAWRKEPGDTLADAVNAVTRAAHEVTHWPIDFREELERQAARLVLVPR